MMRFPSLQLGDEYLHLLSMLEAKRAKARTPGITVPADPLALGGSIYRADQLDGHLSIANKELAALSIVMPEVETDQKIQDAIKARSGFCEALKTIGNLGIIEIQIVQDNRGFQEALRPQPTASTTSAGTDADRGTESTVADHTEPDKAALQDKPRRRDMVNRLHDEVKAAVASTEARGGKVNASNQPHEVTTDVFGEWVKAPGSPTRVRIVYADASEAAPFPLRCLAGRDRPSAQPRIIRVALMSMRHLDIDRIVDMSWYRNREVSQSRSLAESDEYCFRYSIAELRKLHEFSTSIGKPVRLEVFHTGFEPASVGLYRAVTAILSGDEHFQAGWAKSLPPWLIVSPLYYKGGTNYEPSKDRDGNVIEWF
jgi:hypothetical protein